MMLHLLRELHEQIGDNGVVVTAGVYALDDVGQGVTASLRQLVPSVGLLGVDLQQILLENLTGECGFQFVQSLLGHIWLPSRRVCHDMHMGMMRFIMKRRIPPQIGQRDLHRFRHRIRLAAQQTPPRIPFVIAETDSVLAPQRQDFRKHHALVIRHFLCGGR